MSERDPLFPVKPVTEAVEPSVEPDGTLTPPVQSIAIDRRNFLLGGAMLATAGLAYSREPQAANKPIDEKLFESYIPERIGAWKFESQSGIVLPPPDELSDKLYGNLVTRVYSSPEHAPIMLLLAYSHVQNGMLQLHRPEVCYPAGGYRLSETEQLPLNVGGNRTITASKFSAEGPVRSEQVLYWTRVGQQFPGKWSQQRLAVIEANLRGIIPDGILVRISSPRAQMVEALPEMKMFASALFATLSPKGRALLIGG